MLAATLVLVQVANVRKAKLVVQARINRHATTKPVRPSPTVTSQHATRDRLRLVGKVNRLRGTKGQVLRHQHAPEVTLVQVVLPPEVAELDLRLQEALVLLVIPVVAAGAVAPAGTHTGDGAAAGAAGAGAIGIDGAFLAQDAGTGTAGVFDKNADDPSQPSAISQAAAQQASGARAPVIGLFVGGAILLVGLTAINVWVLLQLRRDRREEQYQRPTQYFHGG